MKVHVLVENTATQPEFAAEHGLSLLIEIGGQRILFDTGATAAFADNAMKLGVDLRAVDVCVLSHGHYDHGGGLQTFLDINDHAMVWVSPHAFAPHFNALGKDIGLCRELFTHPRICSADTAVRELAPGVLLHQAADMPTPYPAEGSGMTTVIDGERVAEDFRHEQYLLVEEAGLRVLFSGCSHRGVLNIADYFKADVLVGGFHYMRCTHEDTARLQEAAGVLLSQPTRYYTGHCTGDFAYAVLKERMGVRLHGFSAGDILTI